METEQKIILAEIERRIDVELNSPRSWASQLWDEHILETDTGFHLQGWILDVSASFRVNNYF